MGKLSLNEKVLIDSGRRCCICFGLENDFSIKRGQIAHLDHNHDNNVYENLAFLCFIHHDEYDTKTSQSKNFTIQEVKHYRSNLYNEISEIKRKAKENLESQYNTCNLFPVFSKLKCSSFMTMNARDKINDMEYSIPAYSLDSTYLTFDITNPNQFDLRILNLYIDVICFIEIDIITIRRGFGGGRKTFRVFNCDIDPKVGIYYCQKTSQVHHYLKLSYGEMESFWVNIKAIKEGIYYLTVGIEYSINGEEKKFTNEKDVFVAGLFDPVYHEPIIIC